MKIVQALQDNGHIVAMTGVILIIFVTLSHPIPVALPSMVDGGKRIVAAGPTCACANNGLAFIPQAMELTMLLLSSLPRSVRVHFAGEGRAADGWPRVVANCVVNRCCDGQGGN